MRKRIVRSCQILLILGVAGLSVMFVGDKTLGSHKAKAKSRDNSVSRLQNFFHITDTVYSGGEPKDELAFSQLKKLGIRTIVSVDGARPKVEMAKMYGMRYVHIPIGYDGIPLDAQRSLLRLMEESEAPIYIHCHHGQHRGPAAAAIACLASGQLDRRTVVQYLEQVGTSKSYIGLWRGVEAFSLASLGNELPELVEIAEVESLASAMAKIDRASDNLIFCRDAGWDTPVDHPDLMPTHEALMLKEGLIESTRNLKGTDDDTLTVLFSTALNQVGLLEASLQLRDEQAASAHFADLMGSCKKCHDQYRN